MRDFGFSSTSTNSQFDKNSLGSEIITAPSTHSTSIQEPSIQASTITHASSIHASSHSTIINDDCDLSGRCRALIDKITTSEINIAIVTSIVCVLLFILIKPPFIYRNDSIQFKRVIFWVLLVFSIVNFRNHFIEYSSSLRKFLQ